MARDVSPASKPSGPCSFGKISDCDACWLQVVCVRLFFDDFFHLTCALRPLLRLIPFGLPRIGLRGARYGLSNRALAVGRAVAIVLLIPLVAKESGPTVKPVDLGLILGVEGEQRAERHVSLGRRWIAVVVTVEKCPYLGTILCP